MKNGVLLFICHRCKCDHSRISEFSISLLIAVGRKRGFLCKKDLSHPCYDNCNASLHRQFLICFKPTTLWTAGNVRYTTAGIRVCACASVCVHVCVRAVCVFLWLIFGVGLSTLLTQHRSPSASLSLWLTCVSVWMPLDLALNNKKFVF